MTRNGSLTKDLGYWDIYRDVMVLRDGRFIPVLRFDLPANDLKSTAELNRYNDILAQMLRYAAPEGEPLTLTVHTRKDDLALTEAYERQQTSTHPLAQAMTEDRTELFRKLRDAGQLFQHRAYLSAVSRSPGLDSSRTPFAKLLGYKATYQSLSNAEAALKRAHATKLRSSLSRYLTQAGFTPKVPTAQEVFEVPYRYFNPGSPVPAYVLANEYYPKNILERFPELSPNTLRRQATDSDLDNNPYDHLWLSGHYIVGLTMEKLPDDYSYGSMIQTLLTLPCEKWLTLTMEHVPFAKQLNAFKWKARLLRGFTSASGDDVDPTNESGFTTYRQAIGHMTVDNSHVYKLGLSMFIYAPTLEEAEHYLQLAQVMISEMQGAKFMRERVGLSKRFRALAPFSGGTTEIADLLFQENAADFFPLSGPYKGNLDAPDVMYQTRYDTPVGISVFDPSCKNWNGIVAGAARSGKSFNANDVLAGVLRRQEVEAIVLDKGGSFHETVSLYDGAYIEVVKASINPFDLGEGEWQPSEQHLALLTNLYQAMLGRSSLAENSDAEALLKAATRQLYRKFTRDDGARKVFRGALLEDLLKLLPTMQQVGTRPLTSAQRDTASNLALRLSNWTGDDLKGRFINRPTSVDLNARVICFETAGLEDHPELYTVALMLINHLIWKRLRSDRGRPMFILEDEFAVQLRNPYATAVADEISRTAPKYGAAFWVITQSLKDFDNDQAKAILTNTTSHLLYPAPSEEKLVQDLFELPDHTGKAYRSLGGDIGAFREALFFLRKESGVKEGGVIVVRPTPYSYWTYTTHHSEVALKEATIARYGGDVPAALDALAREHPRGLRS